MVKEIYCTYVMLGYSTVHVQYKVQGKEQEEKDMALCHGKMGREKEGHWEINKDNYSYTYVTS